MRAAVRRTAANLLVCAVLWAPAVAAAQDTALTPAVAGVSAVPAGYVIGPDDVLTILFWNDKNMSAEVTVRPDGRVALPLLNDIDAAGLTPLQLRDVLADAARRFVENPNPTVMVKTINSRKVYITGQVEKPGAYPLNTRVTVLQLIAMAGGLREFVHGRNISLLRTVNGRQTQFRFNYQDVMNGKHLEQNVELRPGDTVVIP